MRQRYCVILHHNGGQYPGACETVLVSTYGEALQEANAHRKSKSWRDGDAWIYTLDEGFQYGED